MVHRINHGWGDVKILGVSSYVLRVPFMQENAKGIA